MNQFSSRKYKVLQKPIAVFLIFLICFSSMASLFYPKKTEAAYPVAVVSDPFTVGGWIKDAANFVKDHAIQAATYAIKAADWLWKQQNTALKIAMAIFRKTLLDYMTDEIIKWIQGGGNPKFVTDWKGFLIDAADTAGGKFLEEMTGSDIMRGLCQPNWAISIRMGLQKPGKFSTRAMCTLSDIGVNVNEFLDNFHNGGWKAWIKVSESQNNPYGLYLMAFNEKLDREAKARLAAQNEALSGAGFLSDNVCVKRTCWGEEDEYSESGTWKKGQEGDVLNAQGNLAASCYCDKWETRTPGKILADGLRESVFKDIDWIKNNEEWESYVVAITNALVNRLVTEGVMALTSSDSTSGQGTTPSELKDLLDTKPPTSVASAYDSWHMQIIADEPVFIYYTLDGSNPTTASLIYGSPIEIKTPTTLKWLAMDYNGNKEGVHTMALNPPFVADLTPPSSVIYAVGPNSIALVSNEPAVIYYTIDGFDPNVSSPRYIKKIDVGILTPVKWFAVDPQGNREIKINAIAVIPPFPDSELTVIVDLIEPVASISAPASARDGSFFKLDPSLSADNDKTPKIVMYEWDFDNNGIYDWWMVDWNRDGVFDESQCRSGADCTDGDGIGNGFEGMSVPSGEKPGVINVKYKDGNRAITLRVTDDEGLYNSTSVTVNVN